MRSLRILARLLGLAAAGAGIWAWPRFRAELAQRRAQLSGAARIIDTRLGAIECAESGQGAPLLVVHGAGGGFDQGMLLGQPLAERGMHVIAMSRFGYLGTPLPTDPTAEHQADAHAALLDALGIERAAVLGVSAGAPSALQFALRHPRRCTALALLVPLIHRPSAVAPSVPPKPSWYGKALDTMVGSDFAYWLAKTLAPDLVIRMVLGTPPARVHAASAAEKARVRALMDQILPVSPRLRGLRNDAAIAGSLPPYPLARIAAPTFIASVMDDGYGTYAGAEHAARTIPAARFAGFESGGHVWAGHHQEILEQLTAFLHGVEAV